MSDCAYENAECLFRPGFRIVPEEERSRLLPNAVFQDQRTGFNTVLFELLGDGPQFQPSGNFVIGFAGTGTPFVADWGTNIRQFFGNTVGQYDQARDLADIANAQFGNRLSFTGHSLGGGQASLAALRTRREAVTFNAAGLSALTRAKFNVLDVDDTLLVRAFFVRGELLSTLQDNSGFFPNAQGLRMGISLGFWDALFTNRVSRHFMDSVFSAIANEEINF